MTTAEAILAALNPAQREAVTQTEGPLLILAGPGSGKTRVIAHRIAYLIAQGRVHPRRILAVTFTNKAAREMRDRIFGLVGEDIGRDITLGTFHAICARTLRMDGEGIGVPRTFAIYDVADQLAAARQAMQETGIDPKRSAPRSILAAISRAKAELTSPEAFALQVADYFQEVTARAYRRYQALLEDNAALDFDDLLVKTVQLFREREDILEKYSERHRYLHIDEFQDTNVVQYVLARQWASCHGDICVVGDPDQSIYTWRAADLRNILNFERDFPQAKVVFLEQNYRSTQTILDGAHEVIAKNVQRKEKRLWTDKGPGQPIVVHEAYDEEDEAAFVAEEIQRLMGEGGHTYRDFVVMYRTNAQSRPFEEAFVRRNMPYRLVGGTRFYERREVKDLLAYLRLVHNPFDSVALLRIINVPPRGIGEKTLTEFQRWAQGQGIPLYAALQLVADRERDQPGDEAPGGPAHPFQRRIIGVLLRFLAIVNELIALARTATLSALLDTVIDRSDYRGYLRGEPDGEERWENVQQLQAVAVQYDEMKPADALAAFLEDVALVADVDEYDERAEAATLLTLHAAKGLEFPAVFVVGLEEGLLPHIRSFDDPAQMEEERRLCYVGMTSAKQGLYLVRAFRRALAGHHPPSRFLSDLPEHLTAMPQRAAAPSLWPSRYRYGTAPARSEPVEAPASSAVTFAAGDKVRHPKFGEGIVVSCQPQAADHVVTVAFKGEAGIKKLLLSFAPLEHLQPANQQ
jgi:DNA helicase-2/ATP-dependent DNA helicase PcrA